MNTFSAFRGSPTQTVGLLPCDRMPGPNHIRFLDEQIADRQIDGLATSFNLNGEHVVVYEIAIEEELDHLWPPE